MSPDDNDTEASKKTTKRMEARDLHFHVLDLVLPAQWERVTPQFWTKDRDSLETYEAQINGCTVQVEMKSDQLWVARLEAPDGTKIETSRFERQPDAVRAIAEALDQQ
jgi:hypothetical protein